MCRGGITRYAGLSGGGGGGGVAIATSALDPDAGFAGVRAGDVDPAGAFLLTVGVALPEVVVAGLLAGGAVAVITGGRFPGVPADAELVTGWLDEPAAVEAAGLPLGEELVAGAGVPAAGLSLGTALAFSTGSATARRGGTGAAARYLSQSVLLPPASVYFCRAKTARLSPAGVPCVRFTDRARYLYPSA